MPPKRGVKRKAGGSGKNPVNGTVSSPAPPDRATWPGWVEMESEPAFFNVMLRDMGVRGVKVQEVYGMEEDMLAILPQPIHALIFLFKYRDCDNTQETSGDCPKGLWFANQTPDFACATFALLNIVNNIPGLTLGKELQTFKDFTQDMDPLSRGDAVDGFDFVRRIHNSFASDNDVLQAEMHLKSKAQKFKKKCATAKALQTKKVKQNAGITTSTSTPGKGTCINGTTSPTRKSHRKEPASHGHSKLSDKSTSPSDHQDGDFKPPTPKLVVKGDQGDDTSETNPVHNKPKANQGLRRSGRQIKPRQKEPAAVTTEVADEEGFHFIAYMPIKGRVWKLDGLNRFPQDVGSIENAGGNWMHVAQPALVARMAQYEESDIQFNLMAIVHDTIATDRESLVKNVKALQTVDNKLDKVYDDWRSMENAETKKELITATSLGLGVTIPDVEAAIADETTLADIEQEDDLLKLIELRGSIIAKQACLRAAVRDALEATNADEEKARHARHDYGTFVRQWLGALADQEVLVDLLEE